MLLFIWKVGHPVPRIERNRSPNISRTAEFHRYSMSKASHSCAAMCTSSKITVTITIEHTTSWSFEHVTKDTNFLYVGWQELNIKFQCFCSSFFTLRTLFKEIGMGLQHLLRSALKFSISLLNSKEKSCPTRYHSTIFKGNVWSDDFTLSKCSAARVHSE